MSLRDWQKLRDETRVAMRRELDERIRVVAKHPDLVARLSMPPIGHPDPRHWNGYIPPLMIEGARDTWRRNPSPIRVHLVAIVHTAMTRTYGESAGRAWLDEINTDQWSQPWTPHHTVEGD